MKTCVCCAYRCVYMKTCVFGVFTGILHEDLCLLCLQVCYMKTCVFGVFTGILHEDLCLLCLQVCYMKTCVFGVFTGILHEDLCLLCLQVYCMKTCGLFLETNVPKSSKKLKSVVGVGDNRIGGAISEELGLKMMQSEVVQEIIRGWFLQC